LQQAKDAALAKNGFDEEQIKKMKEARAEPVIADERGQVLWEVDVNAPSQPPVIGQKFLPGELFCYISTPWHTFDKVDSNFSGRIVEICTKQGQYVEKGDILAYIQREDFVA